MSFLEMAFVLGWPKICQFIGIVEFFAIPAHFLAVQDWRNGLISSPAHGLRCGSESNTQSLHAFYKVVSFPFTLRFELRQRFKSQGEWKCECAKEGANTETGC